MKEVLPLLRSLGMLILFLQVAPCIAQDANALASSVVYRRSSLVVRPVETLDRAQLQARLKYSQKLKLSGIILTASAPVLEGIALGILFGEGGIGHKAPTQPVPTPTEAQVRSGKTAGAFFLFCGAAGPAAFLSGVPLLVTGLVRERRYKKMLTPVKFQSGWLPDGKLGLAMNF
jgi:hypothetical protein